MSVWISDEKLLIFASLISPSKMILFEKKYQIFLPPFHHPRFICNLEYPFPPLGTVRNYIGPLFVFFFDTCTLIPFQNSPYRKLLVHSFLYLTVLNRPHKVTENAYLAILIRFASIDSIALFYSCHL